MFDRESVRQRLRNFKTASSHACSGDPCVGQMGAWVRHCHRLLARRRQEQARQDGVMMDWANQFFGSKFFM